MVVVVVVCKPRTAAAAWDMCPSTRHGMLHRPSSPAATKACHMHVFQANGTSCPLPRLLITLCRPVQTPGFVFTSQLGPGYAK